MTEKYITDRGYPQYFSTLNGLRGRILQNLPIEPDMRILDLATGYGFLAIETAMRYPDVTILGIDLVRSDVETAKTRAERYGLSKRIRFFQMDATQLAFSCNSFDGVVNFLGLEDIHMTRGKEGVGRTFSEVSRILRPGGFFCFVAMPPDEMETEAQRLEVSAFEYACNGDK